MDRISVKQKVKQVSNCTSVPGGIRTHDLLLRRQPLYPAELQGLAYEQFNIACALIHIVNSELKNDRS